MGANDKTDNGDLEKDNLGVTNQEDDLDSIMQELESLDQERESEIPAVQPAPAVAPAPASPAPVAKEAEPVPLRNTQKRVKNPTAGSSTQSLTMELTGTLNLKLGFMTGAKSVELICTDEALVCRFGDGTEVRIPTENPRGASFRKSA